MPRIFSMDSDTWMRSVFESQLWVSRDRSCPHERLGLPGIRAEDHGLLGDPALCSSSPGESGFVPSLGRKGIFAETSARLKRTHTSIAKSILASPVSAPCAVIRQQYATLRLSQPVKLSDALVLDARLAGEAVERSIAGQVEFWAAIRALGRAIAGGTPGFGIMPQPHRSSAFRMSRLRGFRGGSAARS